MKLKKAMKKYDIEVIPETEARLAHYKIGRKYIYFGRVTESWWGTDGRIFASEEEAVSWLIEGATPLSPMERACKKWPIRKDDDKYILNGRHVVKGHLKSPEEYYYNDKEHDLTHYTESEAVAYLLEGYKPKMPDVKVILEHVDVEKDKKITGIDKNVCLGFGPTQAQTVLDTIWRAGYRPTKDAPIG